MGVSEILSQTLELIPNIPNLVIAFNRFSTVHPLFSGVLLIPVAMYSIVLFLSHLPSVRDKVRIWQKSAHFWKKTVVLALVSSIAAVSFTFQLAATNKPVPLLKALRSMAIGESVQLGWTYAPDQTSADYDSRALGTIGYILQFASDSQFQTGVVTYNDNLPIYSNQVTLNDTFNGTRFFRVKAVLVKDGSNTFQNLSDWSLPVISSQYDTTIEKIKSRKEVIIYTSYPSKEDLMRYIGPDHRIAGIDISVAKEVVSSLALSLGMDPKDVRIEMRQTEFSKIFEILRNGEADFVISGITLTPERAHDTSISFSDTYYDARYTLIYKANDSFMSNPSLTLSDLVHLALSSKSQVVAAVDASSSLEILSAFPVHTTPAAGVEAFAKKFSDGEEALQAVQYGTLHLMLADSPFAYGAQHLHSDLRVRFLTNGDFQGQSVPPLVQSYAIAVKANQYQLLQYINNAVNSVKQKMNLIEDDAKRRM